jgi:hypothetical protein
MLKVAPPGKGALKGITSEKETVQKTGYDAVVTDGGAMDISIEYCVT